MTCPEKLKHQASPDEHDRGVRDHFVRKSIHPTQVRDETEKSDVHDGDDYEDDDYRAEHGISENYSHVLELFPLIAVRSPLADGCYAVVDVPYAARHQWYEKYVHQHRRDKPYVGADELDDVCREEIFEIRAVVERHELHEFRDDGGRQPTEEVYHVRLKRNAVDAIHDIVKVADVVQNGRLFRTQQHDHRRMRQKPEVQSDHGHDRRQFEHFHHVRFHVSGGAVVYVNARGHVDRYE